MKDSGRIILDVNLKRFWEEECFLLRFLSSLSLFIIVFFFIFWIGSYFEIDIFPLENRSTNYSTFDTHLFNKYVDSIIIILLTTLWCGLSIKGRFRMVLTILYGSLISIAILINSDLLLETLVLVSVPLITSFFIYQSIAAKNIIIHYNMLQSFFAFTILFIAITGSMTLLFSLLLIPEYSDEIKNYSIDIFLIFSSFSPALIFFLVTGSGIKLLSFKKLHKIKNILQQYQITQNNIIQKRKFLFLSMFMLLSIFLVLIPHHSLVNNENEIVGSDTATYVKRLIQLQEDDEQLFYKVFTAPNSYDRPLSFLLFYSAITVFSDNSYQVMDYLPIIFSPILVLTVFFLTREMTSNDIIALLASFLTAISFQPLIGIYAGLYSNWLALILGYASFVFLLRGLRIPNVVNYLVFSVLLFLMMLSHIYTWTMFSLFISIFLLASYRLKMFQRRGVVIVFLIILASVAFDAGKSFIFDTPFWIERDAVIVSDSTGAENFSSIWANLSQTSLVYAGGMFGNFLLVSLCIYWLLRSNFQQMPNLFLAIFLSIGILPILFGGEITQSRVLYNIPFQIPAAIGLFYLTSQHRGNLLVIATSIWLITMSIQAITNFI